MNKLIQLSTVLLVFLMSALLAIIVYPGHAGGMMYDLEGYKLHKMAAQGDASAQYSLGRHYEYPYAGFEVNRKANYQQAVVWYRKAADQGNCWAQNSLGECYLEGRGVKKDLRQALLWFGKAAEHGSWFIQVRLAHLYSIERNADNSIKKASWFRQSAEDGNTNCQYQLALCYMHGQGVKKDCKEAVRWFREGADKGSADCQYQLGRCYAKGVGVSRDIRRALFLYREAAEQGHEDAQKALKVLGKQL